MKNEYPAYQIERDLYYLALDYSRVAIQDAPAPRTSS